MRDARFAIVIALLGVTAGGSMLSGTLMAFSHEVSPARSQRTLTIGEREAYQLSVEEGYQPYGISPKDRFSGSLINALSKTLGPSARATPTPRPRGTPVPRPTPPPPYIEEWVAGYNGPDNGGDRAYAIAVDSLGNVYVTGTSQGDYATVKYSPLGQEQWVARYFPGQLHGNEARAIVVDQAGNVYVTGSSAGASGDSDYATVKYNSTGQEQWVARYDAQGTFGDFAVAIGLDASDNVYVTGTSAVAGTFSDYVTIKYNAAGQEQWVARYNGSGNDNDEARALAVNASGDVYVTGWSVNSDLHAGYATIKYNSAGQQQWIARYDQAGSGDIANGIAIDDAGNCYVTGESANSQVSDYATVKYDSNGQEQWVARYDGPSGADDKAQAIALDRVGNVYVTGTSYGFNSNDYATIKYNAAGQQQWASRYDGPGTSDDLARAIAVDEAGNSYVTGTSSVSYATVKYDATGQQRWVARYDGGTGNAYAIAVDSSANVYVTGEGAALTFAFDYVTIKYVQPLHKE
jgi:uncharacterized delta-60 repeat protein